MIPAWIGFELVVPKCVERGETSSMYLVRGVFRRSGRVAEVTGRIGLGECANTTGRAGSGREFSRLAGRVKSISDLTARVGSTTLQISRVGSRRVAEEKPTCRVRSLPVFRWPRRSLPVFHWPRASRARVSHGLFSADWREGRAHPAPRRLADPTRFFKTSLASVWPKSE